MSFEKTEKALLRRSPVLSGETINKFHVDMFISASIMRGSGNRFGVRTGGYDSGLGEILWAAAFYTKMRMK